MARKPVKKTAKSEDQQQYWLDNGVNVETREIMIFEELDMETASFYIRAIMAMEHAGNDPITITIMTPGGCVYSALSLYSVIRRSKCPINTIATGLVASAGTVVFLAGKKKMAHKDTTFMFHEALDEDTVGHLSPGKRKVAELERLLDIMIRIYVEHSNETVKYFKRWLKDQDRYVTNERMFSLGMLDAEI